MSGLSARVLRRYGNSLVDGTQTNDTATGAKAGKRRRLESADRVAWLPQDALRKILRGTIKKIADGDKWTMPATIDDPVILDEIGSALKGHGVGK